MRFRLALAAASIILFLTDGRASQSALDPQGPQARQLAQLIWVFTGVCTVVWIAVMAMLVVALLRRRPERLDPLHLDAARERHGAVAISGALTATLLIVLGLTGLSYLSQRELFARERPAVTVKVTGQQWWWDVRYEGDSPDQ